MEYPCKKTRLDLIKRHVKDNDWPIVQWNKRHKMLNSVQVKLSQKEIIFDIQKRTTNYKSVFNMHK